MKTVIIVQARMGSTRFPGKIIKEVIGKPLILFQNERLKYVKNADLVVIATTTSIKDNKIVDLCKSNKIAYFRGDEDDVLARYYKTAKHYSADCIIRINADCPFIDPNIVNDLISIYWEKYPKYDYVANILEETYPLGLHIEVFSFETLSRANTLAKDLSEREHVTPFIYRNPDLFKLKSITYSENLSFHRWTIDFPEDLVFIDKIASQLYPKKPIFSMQDVIDYLKNKPELMNINKHYKKKQTL
jgi:spore coat polysaccharide biosynthesis protein SpsF